MKNIARTTRQLMSLFLLLVASSMMFLSSPAIAAATSSLAILNDENYPTELIGSGNSKPVIGILASKDFNLAEFEELEAKLEAKSDQFYAELIEPGNSKPVIAILALGGDLPILKAKAEKFYGDKYKIVTGIIQ
jgi:hypothetical protein